MNNKQADNIIAGSEMKWYKKQNLVAGIREGYPTSVQWPAPTAGNNYFAICIGATEDVQTQTGAVLQQLTDTIKGNYKKVTSAAVQKHGIKITGIVPSFGSFDKLINKILLDVYTFLKQNNYVGCCMECGRTDVEAAGSLIDDDMMFLCDECFDRIQKALEDNKNETKKAHGNMPLGLIGAVLGAVPGMLLWIFISNLQYQPMFAAAVIILGAVMFYIKLGKKMSVAGFIITIIWSFIAMFIAQWLAYGVSIWFSLKSYGFTFTDSLLYVPEALREYKSMLTNYIIELLLGILFFVFGIFGSYALFKKSRGNYTAKRLIQ